MGKCETSLKLVLRWVAVWPRYGLNAGYFRSVHICLYHADMLPSNQNYGTCLPYITKVLARFTRGGTGGLTPLPPLLTCFAKAQSGEGE